MLYDSDMPLTDVTETTKALISDSKSKQLACLLRPL